MSNISIIGGTGFAGQAIAKEASNRGHAVTILSRSPAQTPLQGVTYVQGSATDDSIRQQILDNADVIVAAAAPRGNMEGKLKPLYLTLANEIAGVSTRVIYIGGYSSLRPAPDQPRFFETDEIPAEYKVEALELATTFDELKSSSPESSDWLFVSPAAAFGAWANVPDTGSYSLSGDVALFDENNESKISAGDFAVAIVDEIEQPQYSRENISVTQ